jgi:hypothetical protein
MQSLPLTRRTAQLSPSRSDSESFLTTAERQRIQIAYLTLVEQEHVLRLAQVRAERRVLERPSEGYR